MSTTAREIFEISMALIDELDSNGNAMHSDTEEYAYRAPAILTALYGELLPLSDNYVAVDGARPAFSIIYDLETTVELDDYLAKTVMPYGLTAMLLVDENPMVASFYQQKYEEMRDKAVNVPTAIEAIDDVYGSLGSWPGSTWS